jgi:hypothetical protein
LQVAEDREVKVELEALELTPEPAVDQMLVQPLLVAAGITVIFMIIIFTQTHPYTKLIVYNDHFVIFSIRQPLGHTYTHINEHRRRRTRT